MCATHTKRRIVARFLEYRLQKLVNDSLGHMKEVRDETIDLQESREEDRTPSYTKACAELLLLHA